MIAVTMMMKIAPGRGNDDDYDCVLTQTMIMISSFSDDNDDDCLIAWCRWILSPCDILVFVASGYDDGVLVRYSACSGPVMFQFECVST